MFTLIAETDSFVLIDKMPGISFHIDKGLQAGLFERVKFQIGSTMLFPVHRLDKVTSGLLLFAKTAAAAEEINQQFRLHKIEKCYLALSDTKVKKKQGSIKGDMHKARNSAWKLLRSCENPAITQFDSVSMSPGKRIFFVKPQTGKTHQIRVALKSISAPIVGDELYGGTPADRCYLHAYSLKFRLQGEMFNYERMPSVGKLFLSAKFIDAFNRYQHTKKSW